MNPRIDNCLGQAGDFCGVCHWCYRNSPGWPVRDDLRLLALAKSDGWQAVLLTNGKYALVCSKCQTNRPEIPSAAKLVMVKGGAA